MLVARYLDWFHGDYHKKGIPSASCDRSLSASGSRHHLAELTGQILAYRTSCSQWMPDSRLTGMTDQRLGIPVLPLTRLLLPPRHATRDNCCGRSTLRRERLAVTSLQVTGLAGYPPRLRVEEACCLTAKTLETHQGTRVFLLLLLLKSIKLSQLYLVCFQSSAAHPQAHARILCNAETGLQPPPISRTIFAALQHRSDPSGANFSCSSIVGIWRKYYPERHSAAIDFRA